MLAVLDLFSKERPVWSAEDIIAQLGYTRPTGYRYVQELCAAGLLNRSAASYALGPRVVELDYLIRECDPLLKICRPIMRRLVQETACDSLLVSMYGQTALAIHHEPAAENSQVGAFGRGRPMELFRGAGSKVILASLSPAIQKRIYLAHSEEIAKAGFGRSLPEFRAKLAVVRKDGYAFADRELDPNAAGLAVRVRQEPPSPPSALILVMSAIRFKLTDKALLLEIAQSAASEVEAALNPDLTAASTTTPLEHVRARSKSSRKRPGNRV
jgi:DNA-binding IclR family transcriptional regulator